MRFLSRSIRNLSPLVAFISFRRTQFDGRSSLSLPLVHTSYFLFPFCFYSRPSVHERVFRIRILRLYTRTCNNKNCCMLFQFSLRRRGGIIILRTIGNFTSMFTSRTHEYIALHSCTVPYRVTQIKLQYRRYTFWLPGT
jgi:hypothetical protein